MIDSSVLMNIYVSRPFLVALLLISIRCFQRSKINPAGEIHKIIYDYRRLQYNKPNSFFKIAA